MEGIAISNQMAMTGVNHFSGCDVTDREGIIRTNEFRLLAPCLVAITIVMILHYNTTLTPSSKAIYSGTKYYDTHIEFHSLFLDVSSTDV